ncbi:DUF61 family protein [Methanolobus sp. ZRKC3]|uniref:DUF61 family protein n=1 Tax=Methanolobus sp. ZRKC3 TaxID=3125786 RepID=UPI00324B7BC4
MSGRPSINSESTFFKWMRVEMGKINERIVAQRKSLAQLLKEEKPASITKSGEEYLFDREVLVTISEKIPEDMQDRLRLPIIFFSDNRVPDSCYINDEYALKTLQILGELSKLRRMQKGKVWIGKSIAYSITRKYPTIFQISFG